MISLTTLAKRIEDELNEEGNQTGFQFKIATETGEFEKSVKNLNTVVEIVNGILEAGPSSVTNLISGDEGGILYATQTCYLKFIVKLEDEQNDIEWGGEVIPGYASKLEALRNTFNRVFQHNAFDKTVKDEDFANNNKTYAVTTIYSFEQTGERSQLPVVGDCLTFSVDAYFMYIENGLNTRNVTFLLDGALIPYQSVTVYRTPTMDGNVYSGSKDGATKNLVSQTTLSISLELPALEDSTTANALNYLLSGEQNSHILTLTAGNKTEKYLVTYSELRLTGETIKNAGQAMTLNESPDIYELLSFGHGYYIYEVKPDVSINPDILEELGQYWVFDVPLYNGEMFLLEPGTKIVCTSPITNTAVLNAVYVIKG